MNRPEDFWMKLEQSLVDGSCLAATLSKRRIEASDSADRLTIRPTRVKGNIVYQWASRRANSESHENLSPQRTAQRLHELLGRFYGHAHFFTCESDFEVRVAPDGKLHIRQAKPTKSVSPLNHNRTKSRLIPENEPCPFLAEIGVMTAGGKVRASRYGKYRQVNRFLELVDDVVDHLPASEIIRVVDFGCGKSALTFALHHLLTHIHNRKVQILGIDRNPGVVDSCERLRRKLGLADLEFRVGEIGELKLTGPVDLAVSLHACDTATDDALAQAVGWRASVILAVPCCQHELFDQVHVDGLSALHDHGALQERFASLATDALRIQALEACGYKTQVVEFVDVEHTAKNLLLRAVRRVPADGDRQPALDAYKTCKRVLGVEAVAADRILLANRAL